RNNIENSAFCGSDLRVETVYSSGARTAPNVVPSVTGRKATEAATAKKAAHAPARCSCRYEQGAVKSESETGKHRAHKGELSIILSHNGKRIRLTRQR